MSSCTSGIGLVHLSSGRAGNHQRAMLARNRSIAEIALARARLITTANKSQGFSGASAPTQDSRPASSLILPLDLAPRGGQPSSTSERTRQLQCSETPKQSEECKSTLPVLAEPNGKNSLPLVSEAVALSVDPPFDEPRPSNVSQSVPPTCQATANKPDSLYSEYLETSRSNLSSKCLSSCLLSDSEDDENSVVVDATTLNNVREFLDNLHRGQPCGTMPVALTSENSSPSVSRDNQATTDRSSIDGCNAMREGISAEESTGAQVASAGCTEGDNVDILVGNVGVTGPEKQELTKAIPDMSVQDEDVLFELFSALKPSGTASPKEISHFSCLKRLIVSVMKADIPANAELVKIREEAEKANVSMAVVERFLDYVRRRYCFVGSRSESCDLGQIDSSLDEMEDLEMDEEIKAFFNRFSALQKGGHYTNGDVSAIQDFIDKTEGSSEGIEVDAQVGFVNKEFELPEEDEEWWEVNRKIKQSCDSAPKYLPSVSRDEGDDTGDESLKSLSSLTSKSTESKDHAKLQTFPKDQPEVCLEAINAVAAAKKVRKFSLRKLSLQTRNCESAIKGRAKLHPEYKKLDKNSFHEVCTVGRCRPHALDNATWEHREVKQHFLDERSISFLRHSLGDFFLVLGNTEYNPPVCKADSMEMPTISVDDSFELTEEWENAWDAIAETILQDEHPELGVTAVRPQLRNLVESLAKRCGETHHNVIQLTEVPLSIDERVTRVLPDYTSSLRYSRWRNKYFPGDTFPYRE